MGAEQEEGGHGKNGIYWGKSEPLALGILGFCSGSWESWNSTHPGVFLLPGEARDDPGEIK